MIGMDLPPYPLEKRSKLIDLLLTLFRRKLLENREESDEFKNKR